MKVLRVIFIVLALSLFAVPMIYFDSKSEKSDAENRMLSSKPFLLVDGRINPKLFREYDAYLSDRFGFRNHLVSLNKIMQYTILNGNIFNEHALKGRDGWYFYLRDNNLGDFLKTNLMTQEQLDEFRMRLVSIVEWCHQHGFKVLFLVAPNKHSVYPEKYPFARPEGITRADQLKSQFDSLGIPCLFLRDYLLSKKDESEYPLYWETDTHWNALGAYYGFQCIEKEINLFFPNVNFPKNKYEREIEKSCLPSDIPVMLGQPRLEISYLVIPRYYNDNSFYTFINPSLKGGKQIWTDCYYYFQNVYLDNGNPNGIKTKSVDSSLPRAFVIRDSFCRALVPFLSPLFSETEYEWWNVFNVHDENNKTRIIDFHPDIIIFEMVERYFPYIAG